MQGVTSKNFPRRNSVTLLPTAAAAAADWIVKLQQPKPQCRGGITKLMIGLAAFRRSYSFLIVAIFPSTW